MGNLLSLERTSGCQLHMPAALSHHEETFQTMLGFVL